MKKLILALCFSLISSPAFAAHTYGVSARLPATATTVALNPSTFTINCPAGTTVLWLGIVVAGTVARAGGAPTYNGVAMTAGAPATNAGGTAETNAETWHMLNPPTGSAYTISVPNTGTKAMTLMAATAAAQAGYTSVMSGSSTATPGNSTNPTGNSATGAVGDIIFARVGDGATTWNPTARTGTQIYDWDAGTWGGGAQYKIATATTAFAAGWTFGTSEDWIVEICRFTEQAIVAPTVTTQAVTDITSVTATGNGNVTSDGGATITERGVCWNTTGTPTTGDNKATSAGTTGVFTAGMAVLSPSTHYFVRAYAINSIGTSYGGQVEFDSAAELAEAGSMMGFW